jgi:RHS repeat-associated protein
VVNYSYLPGSDILSGWSNSAGFAVTRAFEAHRGLLIAVSNRYNGGTVSAFDYINDAIARRTQRIDNGSATATNAFGYNPRSELSSARMGTNAYGYAYDPIGNRLAVSNNAEALTYAANALNQYTNITAGTVQVPQYDLDGNLTNYNGWSFAWDAENRLIKAVNGSTVMSNQYDYMSRRVQKVVGTTTNTFLYDGWNLVRETTTTGVTNAYVWGLDLSGSLQGAGGIGGLMALVRNDQTYYYPVADANGNITDYVATNGAVVAHYEFDAFGNTVAQSGALADVFAYRFSTKYFDADPGLYYYGYRYYSPGLGRWVSRDPIGENGGINLYAGCRNNTINSIDPTGHASTRMRCTTAIGYFEESYRFWPEFRARAERMREKGCTLSFPQCDTGCDEGVGGYTGFTPPRDIRITLCTRRCQRKEWSDWLGTLRHEFSHAYDVCLGVTGYPCWSTPTGGDMQLGRICTEIRAYRNGVTPTPTKEETINRACGSVVSGCKRPSDDTEDELEDIRDSCKEKAESIYDACSSLGVLDPLPALTPTAP